MVYLILPDPDPEFREEMLKKKDEFGKNIYIIN
jgi:hypothetical protein